MTTDSLVATRDALHATVEHLLAGDLWRRTGRIGLRRSPGGVGQPELLVTGPGGDTTRWRLRLDCSVERGVCLVVLDGDEERWHELRTLRGAAEDAGVELGAPVGVYTTATTPDSDAPLPIDVAQAVHLADWFALVDDALDQVRRRHADDAPTLTQLWPEHFDLACTLRRSNLGGSAGDADHPEPYLYVGPWNLPAPDTDRPPDRPPEWNEAWGVSLPCAAVGEVADAVAFFERGLGIVTR